jgi:MoxR-vWA-beta-propeller ternary system domain bpX4
VNQEHATTVREFYTALVADGVLRVRSEARPSAEEVAEATGFLLEHEQKYRRSLAGIPPVPAKEALKWAADEFYRAAQFLLYRDLNEDLLQRDLSVSCPERKSAAVCYAVDLTFRFLPELIRLARAASESDPLTQRLMAWAGEWPLSSVGVKGVAPVEVNAFISDVSLRTLYLDRIIASGDVSRLEDARVRESARAALGAHPELAPKIAAALQPLTEQAGVS